jgi:hypothetical protein
MPYRADFRFAADAGERTHRVRNFGEAVFRKLKSEGVANEEFWSQITNTTGHFCFTYPNRQRFIVREIVESELREHKLEDEIEVGFSKVSDYG